MIRKNGLVTFECDKDTNGNELLNSTQRNNRIVWPSEKSKPKAQYRASWKNTCNTTSMVMGLEMSGFSFPPGKWEQPEDNLTEFILTNKDLLDDWKRKCPAQYDLFVRSQNGELSQNELKYLYFPNEIHEYLCKGTNLWLGTTAVKFSTIDSFIKALWRDMVYDNLPIVVSTRFGGFGHIVCVTGVSFKEQDYDDYCDGFYDDLPIPTEIIVDDPWGFLDISNGDRGTYDLSKSGNDIHIPWDFVVKNVKPCNSEDVKWMHRFNHGIETV